MLASGANLSRKLRNQLLLGGEFSQENAWVVTFKHVELSAADPFFIVFGASRKQEDRNDTIIHGGSKRI